MLNEERSPPTSTTQTQLVAEEEREEAVITANRRLIDLMEKKIAKGYCENVVNMLIILNSKPKRGRAVFRRCSDGEKTRLCESRFTVSLAT